MKYLFQILELICKKNPNKQKTKIKKKTIQNVEVEILMKLWKNAATTRTTRRHQSTHTNHFNKEQCVFFPLK